LSFKELDSLTAFIGDSSGEEAVALHLPTHDDYKLLSRSSSSVLDVLEAPDHGWILTLAAPPKGAPPMRIDAELLCKACDESESSVAISFCVAQSGAGSTSVLLSLSECLEGIDSYLKTNLPSLPSGEQLERIGRIVTTPTVVPNLPDVESGGDESGGDTE
jgi:hypothetical protein